MLLFPFRYVWWLISSVRRSIGRPPEFVVFVLDESLPALPDPPPGGDGIVQDPDRVRYLADHVRAMRAAMERGVDVRGYYVWSLMDNLEWSAGFTRHFGIVAVDRATMRRIPKASALYYRDLIRSHGLERVRA